MYNTEGQKDSRFIDAKVVLGSQQLLIKVIIYSLVIHKNKYFLPWQALKEKKFKLKDLGSMKTAQLNEVLLTIGLDKSDISKYVLFGVNHWN